MAGFKQSLLSFAGKPVGFGLIVALIIVATALALFETGILFGAIIMIFLAFGLPVYLGWNKSFRTLLIVALVVTAGVAPLWAAFTTNELYTPYAPGPSADGYFNNSSILQRASVSPFASSTGPGGVFHFTVTAVNVPNLAYNSSVYTAIHVTQVYLWVTDCPYDGQGSTNGCSGNPDFFHQYGPIQLGTSSYNNGENEVWFNMSLPGDRIMYYVFTANYTYNRTNLGYGYSCLGYCEIYHGTAVPIAQQSYYWNEGPITGTWGVIYATKLLPSFYLLTAALGAILVAILFVYRWLKNREKQRMSAAAASAEGSSGMEEKSCDSCGAELRPGEVFCWKCGKQIPAPASEAPKEEAPSSPPLK